MSKLSRIPTQTSISGIEDHIRNLYEILESINFDVDNITAIAALTNLHHVEGKDIIKSIVFSLHDNRSKDLLFTKAFNAIGDVLSRIGDLYGSVEGGEGSISSLASYNEAAIHYDYAMKASARAVGSNLSNDTNNDNDDTNDNEFNYYRKLYNLNTKIVNLIGAIDKTEFLSGGLDVERDSIDSKEFIRSISHKSVLEDLRSITKVRLNILEDSSQTEVMSDDYISKGIDIFDSVAFSLKSYLSNLITDAGTILGEAPCKYTVIGLGSLALRQITPYSDLEFAIITENDDYKNNQDPRIQNYFKHLSHYLNFKVICLGESIIKTSTYDINLGYLGTPSINFDLGGKTPLGRVDKDYDLIATVDKMLSYMDGSHNSALRVGGKGDRIDDKLERILQTSCYICGDKDLLEDYQSRVHSFLTESYSDDGLKHCESRSLKLLSGDIGNKSIIEEFGFKADEKEGQIFDVKQEIYRIVDRLIYNLGILYEILVPASFDIDNDGTSIHGLTAIDIVSVLSNSNLITEEGAHNLKSAITYANILRLRSYDFYGYQKESMDIRPLGEPTSSTNFRLNRDEITEEGALFKFYYSANSLSNFLGILCKGAHGVESSAELSVLKGQFIKEVNFYDPGLYNKGMVSIRLMMYKEALGYFENYLSELQNNETENKEEVACALNTIGYIYQNLGTNSNEAIRYFSESLTIFSNLYDSHHLYIAIILNNLGELYHEVNKNESALSCYTKSLKIFVEYGLSHYIATISNNLGELYNELDKYDHAFRFYKKSLEIRIGLYGVEHKHVSTSLNNLGTLYNKLGDHEQAMCCYEQSLKIRLKLYGYQHFHISDSLNNLGTVYQDLGDYQKALDYFSRSFDIRVGIYGNDNLSVSDSLNNLGLLYRDLGDYDKALEFLLQSLDKYLDLNKDDHSYVAANLNNLGLVYQDSGDYQKALEHFKNSFDMRVRIYGNSHSSVSDSLNNLGLLYRDLGDYQKALELCNQSLEMRIKLYGNDHQDIAASFNSLGFLHEELGNYQRSLEYYNKSFQIWSVLYRNNHPYIATSLNNMGSVYKALGNDNKALECLNKSLEILINLYGYEHPYVAKNLNNIGVMYQELGDYKGAIEFYNKSIEVLVALYGDNYPDLAILLNNLGELYRKSGDYDKALNYYNESLRISSLSCENHYSDNVATILNNLGLLSGELDKYNEAIDYFNKSYDIWHKMYGENHRKIAINLSNLGEVHQELGNYEKALEFFKRSVKIRVMEPEDCNDVLKILYSIRTICDTLGIEFDGTIVDDIEFTTLVRPISNFKSIPDKEYGSVRVVSYNIASDFFDDKDVTNDGRHKWQVRGPYVKKILTDIDADVICLQELSPNQASELGDYLSANYNGLFLSQTLSEIKHTGSVVLNDEVKEWDGLHCGTPLIATFVKRSYHIMNDGVNSGRFWLKEEPDEVPINEDRGETYKGFGNMNSYRAVLWVRVIDSENNKDLFVFNSHYPSSGNSFTRTKCAEVEVNKILEITDGGLWVSAGDKNLVDRDDTIECNKTDVYKALTFMGRDGRDHKYGKHYGNSGTWLGFSYDEVIREVEPEGDGGDVLDLIISNAKSLLSFHHPVAFANDEIIGLEFYNDVTVMSEINEGRYFASDHCLIGADLDLLNKVL